VYLEHGDVLKKQRSEWPAASEGTATETEITLPCCKDFKDCPWSQLLEWADTANGHSLDY
jgi:hypothetical protein